MSNGQQPQSDGQDGQNAPTPQQGQGEGALGGLGQDPARLHHDTSMVMAAASKQWDIPDSVWRLFPRLLVEMAAAKEDPTDPRSPYVYEIRDRLRAIECMRRLAMDNATRQALEAEAGAFGTSIHDLVLECEERRLRIIDENTVDAEYERLCEEADSDGQQQTGETEPGSDSGT